MQTTYTYDQAGRLIEACNGHSHIQLERDALRRVIAESQNGRTLKSSYNADGYTASLEGEKLIQEWDYGTEQQLQQLSLGKHNPLHFTYDPRGYEIQRQSQTGFGLTQIFEMR